MAERERGERGGFMGGYGSRPSPSAGFGGSPASESNPNSIGSAPTVAEKPAPVPQHVVEQLRAVYAEVSAAAQESKALHERLGRHQESEAARVIAARLATIEGNIKALVQ